MDDKTKEAIALFRIAVLGPLISAELEHGDLAAHCRQAAERRWEWPDGTMCRVEARTIENWYYAFRQGGFAALKPRDRKDLGSSDIRPEVADLLVRAKRERPRRSLRRLIRMMERAGKAKPGELSRSAVHRLLAQHKISGRPASGPSAERRSFIYEFAGELLVGDALHLRRPVLGPDGRPRKAYLLSVIDSATRYVPESWLGFSEDAAAHERGLKSALLAHGLWQRYYVDLGSAYVAGSLRIICAELAIQLLHAGPGDAAAKGVIERWNRTWREEVESELPDGPIALAELEEKHRAWLSCEYHARRHQTTGLVPAEHWLEQCHRMRAAPPRERVNEIFLHRARRTVSKTGCVRWEGGWLEVSPELRGKIELRFDPNESQKLPRAFVDGEFACDTVALDLVRNARRKRRRELGEPAPAAKPSGLDPLGDLVRVHRRLTAPLDHLADKEPDDEDPTKD